MAVKMKNHPANVPGHAVDDLTDDELADLLTASGCPPRLALGWVVQRWREPVRGAIREWILASSGRHV